MSNMYGRIDELCKENKITVAALSREVGISKSTMSELKAGRSQSLSAKNLDKIANYFSVSTGYLLGNEEDKKEKISHLIPVVGYVRAGIPISAVEDILDYEEITDDMARQGEFFALKIKGDSMEPRIREGDVVIVRQQSNVDSGDIAVVLVNGDAATVKKLIKQSNGIMLQAFNPLYTPTFFSNKEIESKPVQVLGKVVELRGKFN